MNLGSRFGELGILSLLSWH